MKSNPQTRLLAFAKQTALPYLLKQPALQPFVEQLSFVLVGSVATGFCSENSDVDIAIVCESSIYSTLSQGTRWDAGRPTEVFIDGVQLHYYGITFDKIINKMTELSDHYLFIYSHVQLLKDPQNAYRNRISPFAAQQPNIRKQRIEGKADMLKRRFNVLKLLFERKEDIISIMNLKLELVTRMLKLIALLDNVPFDSRKRLFQTALAGKFGQQLHKQMLELLANFDEAGRMMLIQNPSQSTFIYSMQTILDKICNELKNQGLCTELPKPDMRQTKA